MKKISIFVFLLLVSAACSAPETKKVEGTIGASEKLGMPAGDGYITVTPDKASPVVIEATKDLYQQAKNCSAKKGTVVYEQGTLLGDKLIFARSVNCP